MKNLLKMKLLFGFVLLLVFSSNVSPATAAVMQLKNPGVFIAETVSAPEAIDPATDYESFGSGLNELFYETLVDYVGNSATDLEGVLATSWVVSADGLQYNFTLREGVTFHDGVTFNAYIMKYSLDRMVIMNDHWGPAWMIQQAIVGGPAIMGMDDVNLTEAETFVTGGAFVVLDEYLFQINLATVYTPFLYAMAYRVGAAISPKAIAENAPADYTTDGDDQFGMLDLNAWFPGVADADLRGYLGLAVDHDLAISGVVPSSPADSDNSHDWIVDHEAGTGPYSLVDLDPGTLIECTKYNGWWNAANFAEHSPDQILIKSVNEVATRILDIKGGDADNVYVPTTHASEIVDVDTREVLPSLEDDIDVYIGPTFTVMFFGLNMNETLPAQFISEASDSAYDHTLWDKMDDPAYGSASADNPFSALKFRQAFTLAFDYDTFIDAVTNGFAERMEGVIPNGMFGHHDQLVEDGFLPEFDPDAAQALFEAVNWTGDITIGFNQGNEVRRQGSLLLATTINDMGIGINVNVLEMAWPTYLRAVRGRQLPIFFLGWAPDYADPDNYAAPFLHGDYGIYAPRIDYNNSAVNQLIEDAAIEQNTTARELMYFDLEEMAAKDYAFIYAYQAQRFTVVRSWIQGFAESGSLNPMSSRANYQYLDKYMEPVTSDPVTTTTTTGTEPETTTEDDDGTPGFEFAAIFIAATFAAIYARKRRR